MPKNPDSLMACIDARLKEFADYDQTVDIVSGFESFFNYLYKDELIYFDRFPKVLSPKLTPDFTVLFDSYGLIFEMTRGIAKGNEENGDKPLETKIRQLKKYDANFEFKADAENKRVVPTTQDIVLILDTQNAQENFVRINRKIEETPDLQFRNNLIFLDYFFSSEKSCYFVRKYHGKNNSFRDMVLPEDKRLEKRLGEHSGEPLIFRPEHFMNFKARSILCNDPPSDLGRVLILLN
jgi:hypothetical protein